MEMDILPTLRAYGKTKHGCRIRSWSYFTGGIEKARDDRLTGMASAPKVRKRRSEQSDKTEDYVQRMARLMGVEGARDETCRVAEILPPGRLV